MSRSLVLNATFEPLCVLPSRRAIVLVLADKAVTVHGTGRLVRSELLALEEPSVVRLSRFVRVPFPRRRALNRRAVFARDGFRCQYCGATAESLDHVVPRSRGGAHCWENVVAACRRCNATKRDRLLDETAMQLRRAPRVPAPSNWLVVADRAVPTEWAPYLEPAVARSA